MARELSIFVDESGDLGETSDWYLVSLVLHDQADSLSEPIAAYEQALRDRGLPDIPMHTGPLITGHDDYENIDAMRVGQVRRRSRSCGNGTRGPGSPRGRAPSHPT